jgi:two-component system cell cycle sensor histidine kinase/response regulator CckA
LITGPTGAVRWANAAYRRLSAQISAGSGVPAAPERLFAGAASGAIYRLSRAAVQGERADEVLGRIDFTKDDATVYAADIEPMTDGGAVWRFRPAHEGDVAATDQAPGWAEQAPVGLFLADGEGRLLAANETLRGWIGAREDQALKLGDILAGDGARLVARSRGEGGPARLDCRLVSAQGGEAPAVLVLDWTQDRPALARGVVYSVSATGAPPGLAQIAAAQHRGEAGASMDEMFAAAPFGVARLEGADPMAAVVLDANPALLLLTGGAAVPGTRFADLFDASEPGQLETAFDAALSGSGEPGEAALKHGEDAKPAHVFPGARD